jgi:TRAP-type C4-dicarboxylate transport system substrate-binding protein
MTRWIIALTTALSVIATMATAGTVIKLGSFAPPGSVYHDILLDLQREWAEISNGTIELRLYPGGVSGDEGDMIRKMRIGQLHAAMLTSGGLPDITPEFRAFQVPMMFENMEELDHVLRETRPTLDGLLLKRGFRALGWADAGWLHFFSRQPVRLPDDLRPQRIFAFIGADRLTEAWRDAGFLPRELSATDIHTALQSKMLDAIATPPLIALSSQWFTQIPHMSTLKWAPLIVSLVLSERTWRSLPADLRPKLIETADRAADRMRSDIRHDSAEAIRVMQDYGLTIQQVTPDEIEIWRDDVRASFRPLIGSYIDAELVHQIEETLDAYRASR